MEEDIIQMMKLFEIPLSKKEEVTHKLNMLIKEHVKGNPKTRKWKIRRPQCIQTYLNIRLFPTYQKKLKNFCKDYSINQNVFELELMKLIHVYCKMDLFLFNEYNFYKSNHRKTKRQLFNDFTKVAEKELDRVRPICKKLHGCNPF